MSMTVRGYLACLTGAANLAELLWRQEDRAARAAIEAAILTGDLQAVYDVMNQTEPNYDWVKRRDEWLVTAQAQLKN